MILNATRRPLTGAEKTCLIRAKIRSLTARGGRSFQTCRPITGGAVLILWLWTVLASDAPWLIVTAFWLVVGGAIALWVHRDLRKHAGQFLATASSLESACGGTPLMYTTFTRILARTGGDRGRRCLLRLRARRRLSRLYIRAGILRGRKVSQPRLLPGVHLLDERGETVDMFIDKRGDKAAPADPSGRRQADTRRAGPP